TLLLALLLATLLALLLTLLAQLFGSKFLPLGQDHVARGDVHGGTHTCGIGRLPDKRGKRQGHRRKQFGSITHCSSLVVDPLPVRRKVGSMFPGKFVFRESVNFR